MDPVHDLPATIWLGPITDYLHQHGAWMEAMSARLGQATFERSHASFKSYLSCTPPTVLALNGRNGSDRCQPVHCSRRWPEELFVDTLEHFTEGRQTALMALLNLHPGWSCRYRPVGAGSRVHYPGRQATGFVHCHCYHHLNPSQNLYQNQYPPQNPRRL